MAERAAVAEWTAERIPDQSGRTVVVTGANSGLGFVTARELARRGAHVVLGCRDPRRGEAAVRRLTEAVPRGDVELRLLDMADLSSVRSFADGVCASHDRLDLLVNNAGVMAIPRRETADGFEMQLGTNHLGHFALTGLLLHRFRDRAGSRVVTVSSNGHKAGRIDFDDLMRRRRYSRWLAYSQSKLANLLFAFELQRRLSRSGAALISVAAHPGTAATNLVTPGSEGNRIKQIVMNAGVRLIGQSDEQGALPQLYAATAPEVSGGDYFGPGGFAENSGYPKRVRASRAARDEGTAARLWEVSERLTGVRYPG